MRMLVAFIFILWGVSANAQIYTPSYPTIYGQNFNRLKALVVQHIPEATDQLPNTNDPSPQIRVNNGVLEYYRSGTWSVITLGAASGFVPYVGGNAHITPVNNGNFDLGSNLLRYRDIYSNRMIVGIDAQFSGSVTTGIGTASSPSHSFSGATNSGMYYSSGIQLTSDGGSTTFSLSNTSSPTGTWSVVVGGHLKTYSDNTLDIGGSTNRVRSAYIGTSLALGTTATPLAPIHFTDPITTASTNSMVTWYHSTVSTRIPFQRMSAATAVWDFGQAVGNGTTFVFNYGNNNITAERNTNLAPFYFTYNGHATASGSLTTPEVIVNSTGSTAKVRSSASQYLDLRYATSDVMLYNGGTSRFIYLSLDKINLIGGTGANTALSLSGTMTVDGSITMNSTRRIIMGNIDINGNGGEDLWLKANSTGIVGISTANINRWYVSNSGHFFASTDNTYDIGASGATRPRTGYFGTSVVAPSFIGNLTGTASGNVPYTGATTNVDLGINELFSGGLRTYVNTGVTALSMWTGGGGLRWTFRGEGTESGSNSGYNLHLGARADDGSFVGDVLILNRANLSSTFGGHIAGTTATFAGTVTATSFIKSGGTSSQFLMADGSVSTSAVVQGNTQIVYGTGTGVSSSNQFTYDGYSLQVGDGAGGELLIGKGVGSDWGVVSGSSGAGAEGYIYVNKSSTIGVDILGDQITLTSSSLTSTIKRESLLFNPSSTQSLLYNSTGFTLSDGSYNTNWDGYSWNALEFVSKTGGTTGNVQTYVGGNGTHGQMYVQNAGTSDWVLIEPDKISFKKDALVGGHIKWDNVTGNYTKTIQFPDAAGTVMLENSVSGSFTTVDGKTITVTNGRVTSIL